MKESELDKFITESVWRHFTSNYAGDNWPKTDPGDFLRKFYKYGCYDENTGEEIIFWWPYGIFFLNDLLDYMSEYASELEDICKKYYDIKSRMEKE